MPQNISDILNINETELDAKGIYNAYVGLDSALYIDPSLLKGLKATEFKQSYAKFRKYFQEIVIVLSKSKSKQDIFWREGLKRMAIKENPYVQLGYSVKGNPGSAIGPGLANSILEVAQELINEGFVDPVIFELIGLLQEGIGPDRISDLVIHIIFEDLIEYTQRVSLELGAETKTFNIKGRDYALPVNPFSKKRKPIIFLPKEMLRDLPLAFDWDDVDTVCRHNQELRDRVNEIIGGTWKNAVKKCPKSMLKKIIFDNPELFKDLIEVYQSKNKSHYDFDNDPLGELLWGNLAKQAKSNFPLKINKELLSEQDGLYKVVDKICNKYKQLIEFNGWSEYFYDNSNKLRHERYAQKLLYGIGEVYCESNNLDINREPNAGSGALDFKFSRGYSAKVSVEIKYSSNTKLISGYLKQLPQYNKAEKCTDSIYLVIRTTESEAGIKKLQKIRDNGIKEKKKMPDLIIINGRQQETASNL